MSWPSRPLALQPSGCSICAAAVRGPSRLVLALSAVTFIGCILDLDYPRPPGDDRGDRSTIEDLHSSDAVVDASPDAPALPNPKTHYFPADVTRKIDLLFLVDNSNSMELAQQALTANFSKLIDMLASYPGGLPDLHLGVISPDLGAGQWDDVPSCSPGGDGAVLQHEARVLDCVPPTDPWISHAAGITNVPAGSDLPAERLKEAFECIARLGAGGCGFEHQLEAVRRALDPDLRINPGFVRPDALLAVLLVTDEDDCSAAKIELFAPDQEESLGPLLFRCFEFGIQCDVNGRDPGPRKNCTPALDWLYPVEDYVEFLKTLKPPGRVVLGAIAGPPEPVEVIIDETLSPSLAGSCPEATNLPSPAIRIKAVIDGLGTAALFASICSMDFATALTRFGQLIEAHFGATCLQPLQDTDAAPGLQPRCIVEDTQGGAATAIPPCAAPIGACGPCPCWRVAERGECQPWGGYALEVKRDAPARPGTVVVARCQGQAP